MSRFRWLTSLMEMAGSSLCGFFLKISNSLAVGTFCLVMVAEAEAGTPAAIVAEIARGQADATLADCQGIRLGQGEVEIGKDVVEWLHDRKGDFEHWHAPKGLRRLEDMRLILLLRMPERCEVMISGENVGVMPAKWQHLNQLPFRTWRIRGDGLALEGRVSTDLARQEYKVVPVPGSHAPPLRMYHHGRVQIYLRHGVTKAKGVGPNDTVSFRLEGPGDVKRFVFRAPVAGDLVVERTPGNMPNLDMLIGVDEEHLHPRGMVHLEAGQDVLAVFRYRGISPRNLDIGFLFIPEPQLKCRFEVTQLDSRTWRVRLVLHNRGREPVMVFRPSVGTVEWLAEGRLIAASNPMRIPETEFISPGASIKYEAVLTGDVVNGPDEARVRISNMGDGVLHCFGQHNASQDEGRQAAIGRVGGNFGPSGDLDSDSWAGVGSAWNASGGTKGA